MELLYISTFMFDERDNATYALPSCADAFFEKYLNVFDSVRIIGQGVRNYIDTNAMVEIKNQKISVRIIESNTSPKDFRNDRIIREKLKEEINNAQAILIKPASRKGMMAIKIAEQMEKPYMIEMTGDIHNALMHHPNLVKRMYASILYRQICNSIKNCKFGLYVSEQYLQGKYGIKGKTCGCADVVLKDVNESVLKNRLARIDGMSELNRIDIALVGFYQGKMKGVDTAIRALARLPEKFHLSILGNGTLENRVKWLKYGENRGIKDRIHFPTPLGSTDDVLKWLDNMDFLVLPTRSEGLCRCVVEAMSRGCVCFATNICTMPELLDVECLHELNDDRKLAELLEFFSKTPEKMKYYAQRNFHKSKEYCFEHLKQKRDSYLREFRNYCFERMDDAQK